MTSSLRAAVTATHHVTDGSQIPSRSWCETDFSGSTSQVIRSCWVHLWCSPSAGCNQSAGRLYERAAAHLLRWSCVVRESTTSVGSLCFQFVVKIWVECLSFSFFWPVSPPISEFCEWVSVLCSSIILIESEGGCGFYSYCNHLDTKGSVCFNPFVSFSTCDPVLQF